MNTQAMESVLSMLRATAAQASGPQGSPTATGAASKESFANTLREMVGEVNHQQRVAQSAVNAEATGRSNLDVNQIMVGLERADLSFQEMVEVRNKLVSAYQEIMNLQV